MNNPIAILQYKDGTVFPNKRVPVVSITPKFYILRHNDINTARYHRKGYQYEGYAQGSWRCSFQTYRIINMDELEEFVARHGGKWHGEKKSTTS